MKLTVFVSGMIAGDPKQGGATWAVLQYVLGFRQLGHEVFLIEPIAAKSVLGVSLEESENARYFREVARDFGLENHAALLLEDSEETVGLEYATLCDVARRADVIFNISGMLKDCLLLERIPRRVYVDLDPVFVQLWHSEHGIDMRFSAHTHFVSIGLAIGTKECPAPDCGRSWIKTLQPIVLAEWPRAGGNETGSLTTVGNWRGYGSIEFRGQQYGQKAHSLRKLIELPLRTTEIFELALAIHPAETADLAALTKNGWRILDPLSVAGTPAEYRRFIQGSKAEFGVAKSGYALSQCGWFSDRSVCYLASGRPVLAQDTGFAKWIPTGEGLLAFETVDDVLGGIETMNGNYPRHAAAARDIAENYFDANKVLPRLLEEVA